MVQDLQQRFHNFGPFRVDAGRRLLLREGKTVPLTPKAFDILMVLLQNSDRVVEKDELMRLIWPDAVVEENNLTSNISSLRKALEEGPTEHRFIVTIPGRGYQFTSEMLVTAAESELVFERHADAEIQIEEEADQNLRLSSVAKSKPLSASRGTRLFWFSVLFVIAVTLAWLTIAYASRPPRVLRGVQITNDGQPKWQGHEGPVLVTDGSRIYVVEQEQKDFALVEAPLSGGETVPIRNPFSHLQIEDLDRRRSALLALNWSGAPEREAPLWEYSLLDGSYRRLGDLDVSDASWSADGNKIFYTRGSDLWVSKRDGTGARLLATVPGRPGWPRESPDGRTVRFTVGDPKNNSTALWEVSSSGGSPRPLLTAWNSPPRECCGSWTPDGRYFVFQSLQKGKWEIWALRERTGLLSRFFRGPFQLINGPIDYVAPIASLDDQRLYVVGFQNRGEVMSYDSQKQRFVPAHFNDSAEGLDFSGDGKWVTYVSFPEGSLRRSRPDGTDRQQLTSAPMQAVLPRWSPDGSQIAFMATTPGKPWKIYRMPAAGGVPQELLPESVNECDPTWSPDGKSLAFGRAVWDIESGASKPAIYTLELETQRLSLLPGSEGLYSPRWSPNGRYLSAFSADTRRLMLYSFATRRWTQLFDGGGAYNRWSHDSRYIYWDSLGQERFVFRIDIRNRKIERIASLENLRTAGALGSWSGLAPDDSPMFLRDAGASEVYAFDVELP
jgi:DNA-binding winged helix-turn-helix (wHTH) protein/Tol biopolymer transport system component